MTHDPGRHTPTPGLAGFILLIWLLLLCSVSAGAVLVGAILALAIPPITTQFWDRSPKFVRPSVRLTLVPRVLDGLIAANATVASIVLTTAQAAAYSPPSWRSAMSTGSTH